MFLVWMVYRFLSRRRSTSEYVPTAEQRALMYEEAIQKPLRSSRGTHHG